MGEDEPVSNPTAGELLHGGVGNAGAVVRSGNEVLRPLPENHRSIHLLLRHLRSTGFDGVPQVLGTTGDGRERLGFIPGDVPISPFPSWSQADDVLASISRLLRRYHDAVAGFAPPPDAAWSTEMADPEPGPDAVLCHNDLCPENVVFTNASAVAMLDFDFAAPGRRTWDLASMASMCIPLDTPQDAARTGRGSLDPYHRLRVVADAYGLDEDQRRDLLVVIASRFVDGGVFVRRRIERGEQAFIDMWNTMGGQERYDRRLRWFVEHQGRFADALGCS